MFGPGPKSSSVQAPEPDATLGGPHLCVELTPRRREFTSNLRTAFSRRHYVPKGAYLGRFWQDVFVRAELPWASIRKSYLSHALAITVVWAFTQWGLLGTHEIQKRTAFDHTTITYYNVSEYLPPLNPKVNAEPAKVSKRADPKYAKQEIISIRPNSDNNHQTIVSPSSVKLDHDVALPNIVAWNQHPAPPTAAISRTNTNVDLSSLVPTPVAPAPQVTRTGPANLSELAQQSPVLAAPDVRSQSLSVPNDILARSVVAPPPTITRTTAHSFDVPTAAVAPPAAPDALRQAGQINIGKLQPAMNPSLAAPEQQAIAAARQGGPHAGAGALAQMAGGGQPVAPAPSGIPGSASAPGAGQLVALSINPTVATGPITVPNGSRNGTFAAGPTGNPNASGTPEIVGDGKSSGPGGTGANTANPLEGIHVGAGPAFPPATGVVVAGPNTTAPAQTGPSKGGGVKEVLMAALKKPTDIANVKPPDSLPDAPGRGADEVFGAKKFYTMRLNMANLTSSSGTWIMRFAELTQTRTAGELTAPVALSAVHPAYPLELIRDRVEGTVVLYAVIHSDGSVGQVRVLHGVDTRLDTNARRALERWRFRPGTKNGSAVEIEAVVQIPFVAGRRAGF